AHPVAQRPRVPRLPAERTREDHRRPVQRAAGPGGDRVDAAALERGERQAGPGQVHPRDGAGADEAAAGGPAHTGARAESGPASRARAAGGEAAVILRRPEESWCLYVLAHRPGAGMRPPYMVTLSRALDSTDVSLRRYA